MDFNLSRTDLVKARLSVETFNKSLIKNGREIKNNLGKDDFLKLLITQLKYQDPTKPMEDKAFIAQMAQFSSLEQMQQMNTTMTSLQKGFLVNQTLSLLGKTVDINTENGVKHGKVSEISFNGNIPQIKVDGMLYSTASILKIGENE